MGAGVILPPIFMYWIILITVLGINLGHFVFNQVDMWHAQGLWAQLGIMLMFSWSFFEKVKYEVPENRPIGLLHLWAGCQIGFIFYMTLIAGKYDIFHFFKYFNFLCILIFYRLIVQYCNSVQMHKILVCLRYVFIFTLLTAVLQKLGMSQFFVLLDHYKNDPFHDNIVTGFIGNGTQLSQFLGIMCPVLLVGAKRESFLALILMFLVMLFSGTNTMDSSISGPIIFTSAFLFFTFYRSKKWFSVCLISLLVVWIAVLVFMTPEARSIFLSDNGRIEKWANYFNKYKGYSITGIGLGTINVVLGKYDPRRLMHLEYFHFFIEMGIIAIVFILWFIKDFFQKQVNGDGLIFKTAFFAFLVACFFNHPAHIWLVTIHATLFYAGMEICRRDTGGVHYVSNKITD